jgi:hypothetical protein
MTLALHMSVAVCGAGHVLGNALAKAEVIAADVYRDIGVAIEWKEICSDARLAVHLVASAAADADPTVDELALGYAQPGTRSATVLFDRVATFARRFGVKREVLLGYSIAHEMGHLLLPPNSHSISGVMRASLNLDLAATRRLRFTREQGALIVRALEKASATVATN